MSIYHLLKSTKCCDLIKGQVPVVIESSKSIEEGCKELVEHQITSAPIIDNKTREIVGILDYRDLVTFILLVFTKDLEKSKENRELFLDYDRGEKIKYVVENASKAANDNPDKQLSIHLLADLSCKNPTNTLLYTSSLCEAIEIFSKGIHRLILTKENGNIYGILSQSNIVKFLANAFPVEVPGHSVIHKHWTMGEKPIGLARPEPNEIITVERNSIVMDALRIMHSTNLSSLAIVETVGLKKVLRGNISMTDIKEVIKNNKWRLLWYPVGTFFEEIRKMQEFENMGSDKVPIYTVGPDSSVIKVIQKLAVTKGHRVWIVKDSDTLCSVFSLTDFMKLLKVEIDSNAQ